MNLKDDEHEVVRIAMTEKLLEQYPKLEVQAVSTEEVDRFMAGLNALNEFSEWRKND